MGPAAADPGGRPAGARVLAARGGDRAFRHRRHRRLAAGRSAGPDLYRRRRRPAGGDGPHALGRLRGRARRRRAAPAHRRGPLRRRRGPVVGRDRPLLPGPRARRLVAGTGSRHDPGHLHLVGQAGSLPLLPGPPAPVAAAEPDRGYRAGPARPGPYDPVSRLAAILIGGPPATGKSTMAAALAPRLGAALLDLDVATGPLTRVISGLTGVPAPELAIDGKPTFRTVPFRKAPRQRANQAPRCRERGRGEPAHRLAGPERRPAGRAGHPAARPGGNARPAVRARRDGQVPAVRDGHRNRVRG